MNFTMRRRIDDWVFAYLLALSYIEEHKNIPKK